MEVGAQIFKARVMHHRHHPKENGFTYNSAYLSLPVLKNGVSCPEGILAHNKKALISFSDKDHGLRDGSNLHQWAHDILKKEGLDKFTQQIRLITLPRLFGYVFNPVSFWLCLDQKGQLRALISEVNNTFGDTHTYLCAKKNNAVIKADDWLSSEKLLYVSPFLERTGSYQFRVNLKNDKLGIWVNHYNEEGELLLSTSLTGSTLPLTKAALYKAFMAFPLTVIKTMSLIHWQALIIWLKGIKYVSRPEHGPPSVSHHLENSATASYSSTHKHKKS